MTDLTNIEEIVNESGNSFHCKVVNYLRDKKWYTLVSPYYMDSATSKPREIDLIAEKSWVYHDEIREIYKRVNFKLFVECKYISQPNVFWFSNRDIASATQWVTTNTPLHKEYSFMGEHHYLATNHKVAKLFASKNRPNTENEPIYRALNQSLNAMVYMRRRGPMFPELQEQGIPVHATVEMPVILCNSFADFYRIEMENPSEPKAVDNNFQLEVNYAYLDDQKINRTEYFLIDIVDFEKLDDFLKVLENDMNLIFRKFRFDR